MPTIHVASAQPYDVFIDRGISWAAEKIAAAIPFALNVLIIHQPPLAERAHAVAEVLQAQEVSVSLFQVDDAEDGKTIASAQQCWDACAAAGLTRQDAVVGIGGGAVTDLAGFIAATWMRGIKVVQYPTTLLAMVDAAVGGKTGINTDAGKNLVGCFHEPAAVIVDLDVLDTLPQQEIIAGSAEIIKAGFICDTDILGIYERDAASAIDPQGSLPELIERAIAVKARVVAQDLRESNLREILNYGHTYGHAVEHHENYRWRHGHAVAVGMMFEAELARAAGLLSDAEVERHRTILTSIGLPVTYSAASLDTLLVAMSRDKKNKAGQIRFVVIEQAGEPTRLEAPSLELLSIAYATTSKEQGS